MYNGRKSRWEKYRPTEESLENETYEDGRGTYRLRKQGGNEGEAVERKKEEEVH